MLTGLVELDIGIFWIVVRTAIVLGSLWFLVVTIDAWNDYREKKEEERL